MSPASGAGADFERFRGQWGGKIDTGEEMWWSEPNGRLLHGKWARWVFRLDIRHRLILRFASRAAARLGGKPARAVDYGCGTGGTTLNFSSMLRQPITGLDIFETQLKIGRQFAEWQGRGCEFRLLGEDGAIPADAGTLDWVFSLDVLGHVPDIPAVLAEFARALKPGGSVLLFTESAFSPGDRSIAAALAARGADMMAAVPEHISLFPRERLEAMFVAAGFRVAERFSANVGHFFFFPKDYVLLLRGKPGHFAIYALAWAWNRISKLLPFYPWPFQVLRLMSTYAFGRKAFGTSYFYHLIRY